MKWKYKLAMWYFRNRRTIRVVVPIVAVAIAVCFLVLR